MFGPSKFYRVKFNYVKGSTVPEIEKIDKKREQYPIIWFKVPLCI